MAGLWAGLTALVGGMMFRPRFVLPAAALPAPAMLPVGFEPPPDPALSLPPPPPPPPLPLRVPHYRPPKKLIVTVEKAVDLLIAFMNGEGLTGHVAASEIDSYWRLACEMLDIELIDPFFIREALEARSLKIGMKRLKTPEFIEVGRRTGSVRCVVYRIPRCRTSAGVIPEQPEDNGELRQSSGKRPVTSRQAAGSRPVVPETAAELSEAA